jgi:hypothetical protein
MTYSITKQIRILHKQNDWDFVFKPMGMELCKLIAAKG